MTNNQTNYFSDSNKIKWSTIRDRKVAIITTQWNPEIVQNMLKATKKLLEFAGLQYTVFQVPGAYEIPFYLNKLLGSSLQDTLRRPWNKGLSGNNPNKFDGAVTLGCVVKGETFHFEVIALTASLQISEVAIKVQKPVGFGVLTVNTLEQAQARSNDNNNNKGLEATAALLDMLSI